MRSAGRYCGHGQEALTAEAGHLEHLQSAAKAVRLGEVETPDGNSKVAKGLRGLGWKYDLRLANADGFSNLAPPG
jgi:hypothetical protein